MKSTQSILSLAASRITTAAILLGAVSPAFAQPGQNTWTTYLYQGPGTHYMVTGEVPQATSLDVIGCKDAWCEVSFGARRGFIMSEVVATGDPSKPALGLLPQPAAAMVEHPAGPCFEINEKGGNGGNAMTYVCAK